MKSPARSMARYAEIGQIHTVWRFCPLKVELERFDWRVSRITQNRVELTCGGETTTADAVDQQFLSDHDLQRLERKSMLALKKNVRDAKAGVARAEEDLEKADNLFGLARDGGFPAEGQEQP